MVCTNSYENPDLPFELQEFKLLLLSWAGVLNTKIIPAWSRLLRVWAVLLFEIQTRRSDFERVFFTFAAKVNFAQTAK